MRALIKFIYCRVLDVHKWQARYTAGRTPMVRCVLCGKRKWL